MRYFPLMLYASAGNRDWGVGCIESRSYHIGQEELQAQGLRVGAMGHVLLNTLPFTTENTNQPKNPWAVYRRINYTAAANTTSAGIDPDLKSAPVSPSPVPSPKLRPPPPRRLGRSPAKEEGWLSTRLRYEWRLLQKHSPRRKKKGSNRK
jgi:hypothetical protein